MWDGLLCVIAASIGFGSVFVPLRRHPMGDGFYAQLIFCLGILVPAVPIGLYYSTTIYPLAMLGGALWCFGNSVSILLMTRVGMAQGILIWNTASCLMGWATSRFGFFGVSAQLPESSLLNYLGVIVLIIGSVFYVFIKSDVGQTPDEESIKKYSLNTKEYDRQEKEKSVEVPHVVRYICMIFCLMIGCFFGSMLTPVTYMQTHPESGYPTESLFYLLSFVLGSTITSLLIFIIYSVIKRGDPLLSSRLTLPAIEGGIIFGISLLFFMLSNQLLSPTIAYPAGAMLPGLVVSLWSVLYFREIKGTRNLVLLSIAYSLTMIGVAAIAASKVISI